MAKTHKVIEQASRGATYQHDENTFTVYELGVYPRSSVLAGQQSRTFLDSFNSLAEAQKVYPDAEFTPGQSSYREPYLGHLPDDETPDDDGNWDGPA